MRKAYLLLFSLILLFAHDSFSQYCTPTYTTGCSYGGTNTSGDLINSFSTTGGVSNITNNNTGCGTGSLQYYTYYSAMGASQIQGQTVNVSLQSGASWAQGFRIWIDWNNDLDFLDPLEDVFTSAASSTAVQTGSFTVPFSATPGLKRLRVMCRFATVPALTDYCATGMSYGECEDYNFTVIAATPCTGQPVAGTTVSSITSPCLGQAFVLSLNGTTAAGGLNYQWIQSTTGNPGTWTTVTGATNNYLQTSVTTNMCYRCIVTCSTSTLFDTSSSFCVNPGVFSPYSSCYCPCTNAGSSCITNVTLGTLNNTTTGCTGTGNYNFYTSPIPNLTQGMNYLFSVTTDAAAITSFWIDYNHNTTFEPSEWYQPDLNATVGDTLFPIPFTALPGQTRMRVRSRLPGNQNGSGDACIVMGSGETEDYIVNILPAANYDPAVIALNTPSGNCFSSSTNFSATITNYGQLPINLATNPVTVNLKIQTPSGPVVYNGTASTGTLQAMAANSINVLISGVNLYNGGLYTCNTGITVANPATYNPITLDDSLASPITLQNYRPTPGPTYNLCQYQGIPLGQGLTVSGCATPITDSVTINFTLSSSGATPCLPWGGNTPYQACLFATGTMPTLPNPSFVSATLTVTNLTTTNGGWAQETRFPMFAGNAVLPGGTAIYASTQGNPATAATCYTWTNSIPVTGAGSFPAIYDSIISNGGQIKLGYHSTWSGNASSNGFVQNGCTPTVAQLKVVYTYVPNNYVWFQTAAGGTSIYNSSPFDPLSVANTVVTNSNTPGNYVFYVACGPSPNCRVADTLRINPAPVANAVTAHACETAAASNTGIFNLTSLSSLITSTANTNINYYYDPGFFLQVPYPSADTSGSSTVYAVVQNNATGCATSAIVTKKVDTIPDLQLNPGSLICAPQTLNALSLINTTFSTIPSQTTYSYWQNQACTVPYPNPTAISTAGSVFIVATNVTPGCADTIEGIVNIGAASSNIVNQQFIGTYTYSSSSSLDPISTSVGTYSDGLTQDVLTANCKKVVGITDVNNGTSLGNVSVDVIIEDTIPVHNGQPYLKRHFQITPTNQDSAQVCLYALQTDFDEYNADPVTTGWPQLANPTLSNVCVSKVDNGDLNTPGHTVTVIPNSSITTSYDAVSQVWSMCFPVSSFSYFYIHAMNPANAALPVTLMTLKGKRVETTSVLNWKTAQEKNNDYFVVERSRDSKYFSAISGRIDSKGLNGNSEEELNYDYTDQLPIEGHNYYRLRQVDRDGKISYSPVVDIYFGTDSRVNVYPNPVKHELTVDVLVSKATAADVKLMDASGRVVKSMQANLSMGNNEIRFVMDDLADGIYLLKVTNDKGLHYSQSIRKN